MKIISKGEALSFPIQTPIALTIGNFDGVHLGHTALLNRLKEVASYAAVVTFSNNPTAFLRGRTIPYLTTLSHRLSLFEQLGIDLTLLIPFTQSFANQSAKEFLVRLKKQIPFSHLILGHDAIIGCDLKSDLSDIAEECQFQLEYLEPVNKNGHIISSSEIRKSIQEGNLTHAGDLLGRPYSIFAEVQHGAGKGKLLGFHTANLWVEELTLPPLGVYAVDVRLEHEVRPAVANLGYAPTLHSQRPPCLEVHLLDSQQDLYGKQLEVFFLHYLRPEKKFENIDALKNQIQHDISLAAATLQQVPAHRKAD